MAPATPTRRLKQSTLPMALAPSTPTASPGDKRVTRSQTPPRVPAPVAVPVAARPSLASQRPRRAPASAVGLREPYERHSTEKLRGECERRGLAVAARDPEDAKRPKQRLVELLQEADLLAMFALQAQTKQQSASRRSQGRLAPPPKPIRVASRRAPGELAPKAKASHVKKPSRPPPQKKNQTAETVAAAVVVAPASAEATTPGEASASEVVEPLPAVEAPAAAPASVTLTSSELIVLSQEVPQAPPAEPSLAIHQAETVDLTEDPLTGIAMPTDQPTLASEPAPALLPPVTTPTPLPQVAVPQIQLPPPVPAPAPPVAPLSDANSTARPTSASSIRARRGCRFRLINVVLSPDFNTRWSEMNQAVAAGDVNAFWRDVHISFLCQNSFYDKVHFDDVLFQHVDPSAILNHTAQKLQQMWTEIVTSYRRSYNAYVRDGETKPFLEFCGGRLDLLYLRMALLVEPELHKLVLAEAIPRARVLAPASAKTAAASKASAPPKTSAPAKTYAKAYASVKPVLPKNALSGIPSTSLQSLEANGPGSGDNEPKKGPRFVELQNPEMLPDWLLEDQAKTAAERGMLVDVPTPHALTPSQPSSLQAASVAPARGKAKRQSKPKSKQSVSEPTSTQEHVPAHDAKPVQTRDMVLHSSAINSIDDSGSSDYETTDNSIPTIQPTRRRATGKRRRGSSSELMELPSSRELVPHPHKHLHTAVTTTMTRSQEMVLPPDEFDVQHNRLRKINESIDQCYRTLSNSDAILNDMHREDVESDLRFYLGIKKRIQEQIVMFMHGF